jgi:hypothetical protein
LLHGGVPRSVFRDSISAAAVLNLCAFFLENIDFEAV